MAAITVTKSAPIKGNVPNLPGAAKAITVSDTDTYDNGGEGIVVFVGVTGDVAIVPNDGDRTIAVTFKNVPAGSVLPCRAYKVMNTNTTATNLVALS